MAETWPGTQVIEAAQEGDREALAALLSGSHPHVRRFAHVLCASAEDAEDAAQEALIVLYRKIGTLRATGALASWMFRIVRNECVRRARMVVRHREPVLDVPVGSAEDEVMQRLEVGRVVAAIAALPPDQRQVLIMRDVQGHSGRVVATTLGLSTAAMKSRLHRARSAVHQALQRTSDPALEENDAR